MTIVNQYFRLLSRSHTSTNIGMSYLVRKVYYSALWIWHFFLPNQTIWWLEALKAKKRRPRVEFCPRHSENLQHGVQPQILWAFRGACSCLQMRPLTASKPPASIFLSFFFLFFVIFSNLTSGMDYILLEDLQKVYFRGGSLEARWTSNGGHNI